MAKRRAVSRGPSRAATRKSAKAPKAATRTKKRAKKHTKKGQAGVRKTKKKAPAQKARATSARKSAPKKKVASRKAPKRVATKKTAERKAPPKSAAPKKASRKAPSLNRERRRVTDDDLTATLPSSLDFDRTASSARSGRMELASRIARHNESSPAMTAGDVDADWEGAYSSGDETPGGDNPTPDQGVVDDIGRAVGVEYDNEEELQGAEKIAERDAHRWELDPDSAEDDDRD